MSKNVFGIETLVPEGDGGYHLADQPNELTGIQLELGIAVLFQYPFETWVFFFHCFEGIVDQTANRAESVTGGFSIPDFNRCTGGKGGIVFDVFPAGKRGDPEDILLSKVITVLQFIVDGCLVSSI